MFLFSTFSSSCHLVYLSGAVLVLSSVESHLVAFLCSFELAISLNLI